MRALDLFRLDGKIAIVTGGGRGLGEAMAHGLADAGAAVVIASRKVDACRTVAAAIEGAGGRALPVEADVADPADVERLVESAVEAFGGVDILVNNSGVTWGAPPEEMPIEQFDRVMAINVRGVFLMAQAVGRRMIEQGRGGSIVNISSVAAFKGGRPDGLLAPAYSASKGAVVSLTRDLAGSWAQHAIRVNAIAPGWFPTKMSSGFLAVAGDRILPTIPLGRYGEPADIQGAVIFLASSASAYVTGQTLLVDGGQTAW